MSAHALNAESAPILDGRHNLLDFDPEGMRVFFTEMGEKPFRGTQILAWIHQRGVTDFDAMTNLGKALRERLQALTTVHLPEVVMDRKSSDGTRKWLLRVADAKSNAPANHIEMVFIPEEGRGTLCVSSQIGCSLDCSFCCTARQGFNRNLSTAEIIAQVWLAERFLQADGGQTITNVVLMGMGEPLHNFKNVVKALNLMMDDHCYGLSKRRVTLSTSGVVPMIDRLREVSDVSLAVSLHAPNNALRDQLVPLNRRYPIESLIPACRRYVEGRHKRRITFEYVMLDDINDRPEHAHELAALLAEVPAKINLIPFNPFPQAGYRRSSDAAIESFQAILQARGFVTVTRKTRGQDIDAACGQLAGQVHDLSRRHLRFQAARFGTLQS